MAVTITKLGPRSWEFDYITGTTVDEMFTSIHTVITDAENSTGWELHDDISATKKCYKALNADGETYKYAVLDMSGTNTVLITHYETWDNVAHTGTNMANLSNSTTYGGLTTTTGPGQIFLYISPRWFAMATRNPASGQLNNNSAWQGIFGVFEVSRDNPEDTAAAGYPPTVWLNTNMLFVNPGASACAFSPRTRSGATGATALVEISTLLGCTRSASSVKLQSFIPETTNVWNNKDWSLTLYTIEPGYVARGRIYGLKGFTYKKNLFMDKAVVKVDADFFYKETGNPIDHFIIINGQYGGTPPSPGRVIIPA